MYFTRRSPQQAFAICQNDHGRRDLNPEPSALYHCANLGSLSKNATHYCGPYCRMRHSTAYWVRWSTACWRCLTSTRQGDWLNCSPTNLLIGLAIHHEYIIRVSCLKFLYFHWSVFLMSQQNWNWFTLARDYIISPLCLNQSILGQGWHSELSGESENSNAMGKLLEAKTVVFNFTDTYR